MTTLPPSHYKGHFYQASFSAIAVSVPCRYAASVESSCIDTYTPVLRAAPQCVGPPGTREKIRLTRNAFDILLYSYSMAKKSPDRVEA